MAQREEQPSAQDGVFGFEVAVCDKLHDYLYGSQFQVVTDNNPLTYILSKAKLDAT